MGARGESNPRVPGSHPDGETSIPNKHRDKERIRTFSGGTNPTRMPFHRQIILLNLLWKQLESSQPPQIYSLLLIHLSYVSVFYSKQKARHQGRAFSCIHLIKNKPSYPGGHNVSRLKQNMLASFEYRGSCQICKSCFIIIII